MERQCVFLVTVGYLGKGQDHGINLKSRISQTWREISAPWLRELLPGSVYLFFIIDRGQKLLLLAKEPVIYTFIQSVFIKHEVGVCHRLGPGATKMSRPTSSLPESRDRVSAPSDPKPGAVFTPDSRCALNVGRHQQLSFPVTEMFMLVSLLQSLGRVSR